MRVWADVYSPDGSARLGSGPLLNVRSASVTRALDGAGSISITVPGTDERALNLLQNKRRLRIFVEHNGTIRELGRGVIEELNASDNPSGWTLTASGPDDASALKYKNTLLARLYHDLPIANVIADLVGLAGWTATTSATGNLSIRMDGESVLKALQVIAEQQGLHFRLGTTPNSIEVGAFGADSGLRCFHVESFSEELYRNDSVLLIDTFRLIQDSKDLCNWLLPIGAGEGEAALTLQYSDRTAPYPIQTMTGPDGRILYYLSDSASVTTYGQIEKVGAFKNIAPLSNSDADLRNAANAMYDAAVAWLTRHKDKLDVYSLTVRKARQTVRPGDKVHVRYKGLIYRDSVPITYRDINTDLWVMECTERIGVEGMALDLKVATVDRHEMDAAQIVIGAIEAISLRNVKVQPYPSTRSYVYLREIAPTFNAVIPVEFTNATLTLQRCRIVFTTRPFRATATAAASGGASAPTSQGGGDHKHLVAKRYPFGDFTGTNSGLHRAYQMTNSIGGFNTLIPDTGPDEDLWTYASSGQHSHDVAIPSHAHDLVYGIQDDTQTPTGIQVFVDGIDRTTELGGPFATSPGMITQELNVGLMTDYLVSGGLRQKHTVEIRCTGGQGEIEATVEISETVQSIALT